MGESSWGTPPGPTLHHGTCAIGMDTAPHLSISLAERRHSPGSDVRTAASLPRAQEAAQSTGCITAQGAVESNDHEEAKN